MNGHDGSVHICFLLGENPFPATLIDDSNSNMSFPSPAPTSEDSQDAVTELQSKKDDHLTKPIGKCPVTLFVCINNIQGHASMCPHVHNNIMIARVPTTLVRISPSVQIYR